MFVTSTYISWNKTLVILFPIHFISSIYNEFQYIFHWNTEVGLLAAALDIYRMDDILLGVWPQAASCGKTMLFLHVEVLLWLKWRWGILYLTCAPIFPLCDDLQQFHESPGAQKITLHCTHVVHTHSHICIFLIIQNIIHSYGFLHLNYGFNREKKIINITWLGFILHYWKKKFCRVFSILQVIKKWPFTLEPQWKWSL